MNRIVNSASLTKCWRQHLSNWMGLSVLLGAIFIHGLSAFAQQLETLSVGRETYRNVSIQNKTASHVFLQHDNGLAVIKLRDLPMSVMQQLGFAPVTLEQQKELKRMQASTNQLSQMIPIKVPPQLVEQSLAFAKPFQAEFETRIRPVLEKSFPLVITGLVLTHLLFSFCFMLICQKAKYPAGLAIWIPLIQIFPLMGAAKMSKWLVLLLHPARDQCRGQPRLVHKNLPGAQQVRHLWDSVVPAGHQYSRAFLSGVLLRA